MIATSLLLVSCGGGGSQQSSAIAAASDISRGVEDVGSRSSGGGELDCSGSADKALGGGSLCADTGFRSGDGFAFANWASYKFDGDDVGVADMVALFGAQEVCVDATSAICTLNTGAELLRQNLGTQIAAGRCEGLVLLSGLIAAGKIDLTQFGSDVRGIGDLGPRNVGLVAAVNYWWATQFDPIAVDAATKNRIDDLSSFLTRLSLELVHGTTSTIGIYSDGTGHALLPVAITQNNDGTFAISVYDSNFPGEIRQLLVDSDRNQWSYEAGDLVSGNKSLMQGTGGSIDFTPLDSRMNSRPCDGCGGEASVTSDTVISIPGITLNQ
jgi:hypothetical protein